MRRISYEQQETQVDRLIRLFGTQANLIRAMRKAGYKLNRTTISKWRQPRSQGGADGRIPSHRIDQIKRAGRLSGILITERIFWEGEI